MFHFPEPLPVDFVLRDVQPSRLSDGLFFNGAKPGPTHKCVAKQLSPVKRKPKDPVLPIAKLDARVLDAEAVRGKAFYADTRSGRVDARDLHNVLRSFRAVDEKFLTDRKSTTIFPRPARYEYLHAKNKNRKIDDTEITTSPRRVDASSRCPLSKEILSLDVDVPFWWKPKLPDEHCVSRPIGFPYDRCGADPDARLFNKDVRNAREVDENNGDDENSRWRPSYGTTDVPKTEAERAEGMSELLKPYLHELDTWYSNTRSVFKR